MSVDTDATRYVGAMCAYDIAELWRARERARAKAGIPNAHSRGVRSRIIGSKSIVTWSLGCHVVTVRRALSTRNLVWLVSDGEALSPEHQLDWIQQVEQLVEMLVDGRAMVPRVHEVLDPRAAAVALARRVVELEEISDSMARHAR